MINRKRIVAGAALLVIGAGTLSGCSGINFGDKATEPYQDAPRTVHVDYSKAQVIAEPDGFSNLATKCIAPGVRGTVIYHANGAYGDVSTVLDPACKNFAVSGK